MRIFLAVSFILIASFDIILAQNDIYSEAVRYDHTPSDSETQLFGMLGAYDSYFEQATGFGLNFVRFRPRGYDSRYRGQRFGGLALTDWFRGVPAWNATNGLSQAGIRSVSETDGIPYSVGSRNDLDIAPWRQRPGGRLSLSTGNRNYTFRGIAQYASGENLRNGWSYSLYASRTSGRSYMIDGYWNDAWSLFGTVGKRFGDRHRLSVTVLYTPTERAAQSASTDEAFQLTGKNLYNPAWGRYDGKQRSANVRESRQPVFILSHEFEAEKLKITTSAMGRFGKESYSALMWQNAPNPRPDYYRHMPSFQTTDAMRERVAELWRTDENVRQIDWQAMVDLNHRDGPRAHYIIEDRVRDYLEYTVQSVARWQASDHTVLSGGIEFLYADNLNFKRVNDLLGADYWLDIDSFVENDEDVGNKTQNNMLEPNRRVREGDEFGYKYTVESQSGRLWAGVGHQKENLDMSLTISGGVTSFQRFGYYEKENFAGNESVRYSKRLTQPEWLIQGDVGYRIGGRLRAGFRLTVQDLSPLPSNSFITPEYRNAVLPDLKNERILGAELRFDYRVPNLKLYAGAFWTQFSDRTEVRYFYDDFNHFYCNYIMEGIDTRHAGIEASAEIDLADNLKLNLAGVWMDNRYTSNPFATEWKDATGDEVLTERVYYKDLKVPNGPQMAGVLNLVYSPRSWTFSASLNAYGNSYIAPTPLRRTFRSTDQARTPEERDEMIRQERFAGGATVDLFLGKTVYLRSDHRLGFYAGVNNVFNRKSIRTGGYESSRMRYSGTGERQSLRPLDSKYYHALGTNFFFTASWRF